MSLLDECLKNGLVYGFVFGLVTLVVIRFLTHERRESLNDAATIEVEENRSQEGRSVISFMRRGPQSEADALKRELKMTDAGRELTKMNRKIWISTGIAAVSGIVTGILVRLLS